MTDYLGQEINPGDLVVIKIPRDNFYLGLGRVFKITPCGASIYCISNYTMMTSQVDIETKQRILDALLSDDFEKYYVQWGIRGTLENGNITYFHLSYINRDWRQLVKVGPEQVKNFIECRL